MIFVPGVNWCYANYIWGHSGWIFNIKDLVLNLNHVPEESGIFSKILMTVMWPVDPNKKLFMHTHDKGD